MLGFTVYDLALIVLCPLGATVGSFAHIITLCIDLKGPPRSEDDMREASPKLQEFRGAWMGLRMMLSAVAGLVVGLYFVGLIHETPANLGRIIALSVLVGYLTPKLINVQDKLIDSKIKNILKNQTDTE
ncbi:hypothetical protein GCM10009098_07400 [Rheinheimera aquimaris]|uniref:Uncharacterized protein n=1 Tax=Rheinheimera aquimaris TaxID=412437 RepID=A0ABN1DFF8_9GAMM|nr:hypothetical protein [Rheinheimera aquimaris]MCB5212087.1 hypothetical protein [Rheinheimera aquimaris]